MACLNTANTYNIHVLRKPVQDSSDRCGVKESHWCSEQAMDHFIVQTSAGMDRPQPVQ